jgi:hypothetical protein
VCQGDCDNDDDCLGSLVCFQRNANITSVPGCSGTPLAAEDYCVAAAPSAPMASVALLVP